MPWSLNGSLEVKHTVLADRGLHIPLNYAMCNIGRLLEI